jgi:hypothetical protein
MDIDILVYLEREVETMPGTTTRYTNKFQDNEITGLRQSVSSRKTAQGEVMRLIF